MTFQQLEYIVAVEKFRHFVNAATFCGVTQATLSSSIAKLEQEIDVVIFDRSKHPIEPTVLGARIIKQADVILHNSEMLRELVLNEKQYDSGNVRIGMLPSLAPAIFPQFAGQARALYPKINTQMIEAPTNEIIEQLQKEELDMALINKTDVDNTNLYGVELFTERFMLYISPAHMLHNRERVLPEDLQDGDIWVLKSFHDRYQQLSELVHRESMHTSFLMTGSLATLISLVDANGGYTLIPQLYINALDERQRQNVRVIQSPKYFRTISLAFSQQYMRERMLNIVTDIIKHVVPEDILTEKIKKYKITL